MSDDLTILANKALEYIGNGARIGIGSGRTTEAFLRLLAEKVRHGLVIRGVPTSNGSARLARELGIPLDTLEAAEPLDVTIDGADEVEPKTLGLIKGWGAALVRERIVAAASRRQIIIVTPEKLVERLGARGRLPVEVLPFAAPYCQRSIERLDLPGGVKTTVRQYQGQTLVTDNGNWILDCAIAPLADPAALERELLSIPGVVDTGLFLGTASLVLLLEGGTVRELLRPGA